MRGFCYLHGGETQTVLEKTTKNPKFLSDNHITQVDSLLVCCEGFTLNAEPEAQEIARLHDSEPGSLPYRYQGSYVIAVLDERTHSLAVVNDLFSKRSVYYYADKALFAFSTSFMDLYDMLTEKGIHLSLCQNGIESMLTSGSFSENYTYFEEIKYLMPYQWLHWDNGLTIHELPMPKKICPATTEEVIETIDELFAKGVALQVKKNEDHSYQQTCSLSGGMDSRATFVYVHRLASPGALNTFTYSQSNSFDHTIAQRIARDSGAPNLFVPIDNGTFILDRERLLDYNEGQMYYCGTTGLLGAVEKMDLATSGIVHTGLGGGEIMGDLLTAHSDECIEDPSSRYPTEGYCRNLNDFRTCLNFAKTASPFFETSSPFLFEEFYEYMLSLPSALKLSRRVYASWFSKKMPTPYPTTYFYGPIAKAGVLTRYRRLLSRLKARYRIPDRWNMNPFDQWWAENKTLRPFVYETFEDDMDKLSNVPAIDAALRERLTACFEKGLIDKLRVLTVTGMLSRFYFRPTHADTSDQAPSRYA